MPPQVFFLPPCRLALVLNTERHFSTPYSRNIVALQLRQILAEAFQPKLLSTSTKISSPPPLDSWAVAAAGYVPSAPTSSVGARPAILVGTTR